MTPDELRKIADKIAKCLALAASDNPAEAEAAKRQAAALMKKYNLTSGDVAAATVHEEQIGLGSPYKPPLYVGQLAVLIAKAFGCGTHAELGFGRTPTRFRFYGLGIKPELAAYTFDVLRRRIAKDRKTYAATLTRCKQATKVRRADLFCQAWVTRIALQVNEFAGNEQEQLAIEAYKEQQFGDSLKPDGRSRAIAKQNNDWRASEAGYRAAEDVSLHKPIQTKRGALLGAG
ncbi:DUF7168 domain-containing protein [Methylomonas sp. MS20]|uniref:DUF7168 domain-containing protein n=1 Tax=unclassified Methylomonas TaxID=2608980 RepID=UPI0028A4164A|nr:DUF2786 domain-containing protein [Methylomonas sp. MV1]MDT4328511.1 DUF2786 domain-containing protein [Methylomonas sp. MV1]